MDFSGNRSAFTQYYGSPHQQIHQQNFASTPVLQTQMQTYYNYADYAPPSNALYPSAEDIIATSWRTATASDDDYSGGDHLPLSALTEAEWDAKLPPYPDSYPDSYQDSRLSTKRKRKTTPIQRVAANIRERRRMCNLNVAFDTLRPCIPVFPHEKRLSRIQVME